MTVCEILSIVTGLGVVVVGMLSFFQARYATKASKNMFKKQGVIELHTAWKGVCDIDKNQLVGIDIINAANALHLTASLWNHDVIDRKILHQSYWESYKKLFDTLNNIDELIPGQKRTCKSLMTNEIQRAYKGMEEMSLSPAKKTRRWI